MVTQRRFVSVRFGGQERQEREERQEEERKDRKEEQGKAEEGKSKKAKKAKKKKTKTGEAGEDIKQLGGGWCVDACSFRYTTPPLLPPSFP